MRFDELPEKIRVKLEEDDERQLWQKIEEKTVQKAAEETNFSASKIYNWKNKDSFLPVEFVKHFLENVQDVRALKGGGRSHPIKNIRFPIESDDELLTRIECSVSVNKEGVPIYQTDDRGNAARFVELLRRYDDVSFEVYNRDSYEVRYPKYLNQILDKQNYTTVFSALVDEKGFVENGYIGADQKEIRIEDVEEELFSRSKRLSIALAKENSEEIARLMAEESKEIRELIQ